MGNSHNPYLGTGRYSKLPVTECKGIRSSLISLIMSSNDSEYISDGLMRLEALDQRLKTA